MQAAIERIVVLASEAVIEIGRRVADALNAVFGTDFTGRQVLIGAAILKLSGVFGVLAASIKVARAAWLLFAAAPIGRILTLTTAAVAGVAFW